VLVPHSNQIAPDQKNNPLLYYIPVFDHNL
jgi:hypothetical protein